MQDTNFPDPDAGKVCELVVSVTVVVAARVAAWPADSGSRSVVGWSYVVLGAVQPEHVSPDPSVSL